MYVLLVLYFASSKSEITFTVNPCKSSGVVGGNDPNSNESGPTNLTIFRGTIFQLTIDYYFETSGSVKKSNCQMFGTDKNKPTEETHNLEEIRIFSESNPNLYSLKIHPDINFVKRGIIKCEFICELDVILDDERTSLLETEKTEKIFYFKTFGIFF